MSEPIGCEELREMCATGPSWAAARIEELEAAHNKLRHAVAACCVGWDERPPHGEAIVAALRRALALEVEDNE